MATYFHVVDDVVVNLIEAEPDVVDSLNMDGELIELTEGFSGEIGESWSSLVAEHEQNVALTSERFDEINSAIDVAFTPVPETDW